MVAVARMVTHRIVPTPHWPTARRWQPVSCNYSSLSIVIARAVFDEEERGEVKKTTKLVTGSGLRRREYERLNWAIIEWFPVSSHRVCYHSFVEPIRLRRSNVAGGDVHDEERWTCRQSM